MSDSTTLYNPIVCGLLFMLYTTFVLDHVNKSTLLSQDVVLPIRLAHTAMHTLHPDRLHNLYYSTGEVLEWTEL